MLKRILTTTGVLLLLVALVIAATIHTPAPPASQAFVNASVLTMDENDRVAEAVYIENNRIVAVGTGEQIDEHITSSTYVVDLEGRTVIPGVIDAHGHFPGSGFAVVGVNLASPPVGTITSIEETVETLRAQAEDTPEGEWIMGYQYDDTLVKEKRHPTRHDLDRASTDHPIVAMHVSGHLSVANSKALELLEIDRSTKDPEGGIIRREESGDPDGVLEETAAHPASEAAMNFSAREGIAMVDYAAAEYASMGVTTAQSGLAPKSMIDALYWAQWAGRVPIRLEVWGDAELGRAWARGEFDPAPYASDDFRVGAVKIVHDGSIQGYTGYLSEPYHVPFKGDESYRGYPIMKREELAELVTELHEADLHMAIHGNGDAAIDDIIFALDAAQKAHHRPDPRTIVIHSQMARDDQLDRMLEVGLTPSFFVAHTYYWGDRHRDIFMGPERAERMSPAATSLAKGLRFSIHLDTPVVPIDPMLLVWTAVNRRSTSGDIIGPNERISPIDALRAITIDAAWQINREDELGSLEAGKLADLVVLDQNPVEVAPGAIRDIEVERTVVGGRTVFERERD
ncbi:MAG: amidohydrolase [Myxococcota bacterium]|jgi:hypothetical protein|nr:amidohydrolase [Myxococcota bacterium]